MKWISCGYHVGVGVGHRAWRPQAPCDHQRAVLVADRPPKPASRVILRDIPIRALTGLQTAISRERRNALK